MNISRLCSLSDNRFSFHTSLAPGLLLERFGIQQRAVSTYEELPRLRRFPMTRSSRSRSGCVCCPQKITGTGSGRRVVGAQVITSYSPSVNEYAARLSLTHKYNEVRSSMYYVMKKRIHNHLRALNNRTLWKTIVIFAWNKYQDSTPDSSTREEEGKEAWLSTYSRKYKKSRQAPHKEGWSR